MLLERKNTTAVVLLFMAGAGLEALLLWSFLSHQAFAYTAQQVREHFWKLSRLALIPWIAFAVAVPFALRRRPQRSVMDALWMAGVGIGALLLAFPLVHNGAAVLLLGWCAQSVLAVIVWIRLRHAA
jgi:hypothetical protein